MEHKTYDINEYKEIDDETIQILASDETLDRDNDIIKANGWDVSNWLRTGSILYGHNPSGLPVGTAEGAEIRGKKLYVYTKLAKKGTSEWHDALRSLVEQKILKGVSVGFKPTEWDDNEFGGRTFKRQELLEVSLTPIPSNTNARLLVKDYSIDIQDKLLNEKKSEVSETIIQEEVQVTEPEEVVVDETETMFIEVVNRLKSLIGGH